MNTQIKIEDCEKPYCVIHAKKETKGIQDVAEKIRRMDESGRQVLIPGWDGDYCIQLKAHEIFRMGLFMLDCTGRILLESRTPTLQTFRMLPQSTCH